MNRRDFLLRSAQLAVGGMVLATSPALARQAAGAAQNGTLRFDNERYQQFRNPDSRYRPFVRWWWNGNKVQAAELVRELHLLKAAGIGGVEINPVKFPRDTDDLGARPLKWLSDEWIEMLQVVFDEAKKLDMTCDLIVGSGWPFGGEFLQGEERGSVMVVAVQKITGPTQYQTSMFNLLKEADPKVSSPYPGRTLHMLSLQLVPDPMDRLDQAVDLSEKIGTKGPFTVEVPAGKHALYALVRIDSFGSVIQGAPGAQGPTLNHLNQKAVEKYLNHMSEAIQAKTGALSTHIRSLFTDSMELEGANWTADFAAEFERRRGYDIMPYLQYTMYKTGGMGNVVDYDYAVGMTPAFKERIDRMRYDVELTKAEMFRDRFTIPYNEWCRKLQVKSRAQAYGRGFFPLESGMYYDIPEGESWTTNYLQHRIGEEMSNEDYRRGRAYTMVNKYISSGAHLSGKRLISAEEMTNTYRVFNATLEFLKIGCDQNAMAGITHSVLHGFNYSPAEAPFPGWVIYGSFYNEKNNWWPYFNCFTTYRGRLCSQLQHADMYADIAILPPVADMWTSMGMQNEPFPSNTNVPYQTLVWEAMNKNGNGTDYVSEPIIREAQLREGKLCYGPRSYKELFLIEVESMEPATLEKLYAYVQQGGRLFCIEKYPDRSLGWNHHAERDDQVRQWVEKLKEFPERFILLHKPDDNDFMKWYPAIQEQYALTPSVRIDSPDPYVMVNRYLRDGDSELYFFANAHLHEAHTTRVVFPEALRRKHTAWVWNLDDGERYRLPLDEQGGFTLDLGPADARLIVFDRNKDKDAPMWSPLPVTGPESRTLEGWELELHHSLEGWTKTDRMESPKDLKETDYVSFTGTVTYRTRFTVDDPSSAVLNLGKVYGVALVKVNGKELPVSWYGHRLYDLSQAAQAGENQLEVSVVTTMGNYLQSLKDNKLAQKWTNRPGRPQPVQSMGLAGPVTLYRRTRDTAPTRSDQK